MQRFCKSLGNDGIRKISSLALSSKNSLHFVGGFAYRNFSRQRNDNRRDDWEWQKQLHPKDWKPSQYGDVTFDARMYDLPKGESPGFGHTPDAVKELLYQLHKKDSSYWTYERLSRKFGIIKERVAASIILKQNERDHFQGKISPEHVAYSNFFDEEYESLIEEASAHFKRDLSRDCPQDERPEPGDEMLVKHLEVKFEDLEKELAKRDISLSNVELQNIEAEVKDAQARGLEVTFEIAKRDEKDETTGESPPRKKGLDIVKAYLENRGIEPDEKSLEEIQKTLKELGDDADIQFKIEDVLVEEQTVFGDDGQSKMRESTPRVLDDEDFLNKKVKQNGKIIKEKAKLEEDKADEITKQELPELQGIPGKKEQRSKFAFKDISVDTANTPTIIISHDKKPRYATEDEEEFRSWVPKKNRLFDK
mmetsp:Transcript_23413/g.30589  ORF Transcript_23413/g.30589 Transcript_23413/m.30589 type:complete len:422 (+) Transcript_23413:149-1414(+)